MGSAHRFLIRSPPGRREGEGDQEVEVRASSSSSSSAEKQNPSSTTRKRGRCMRWPRALRYRITRKRKIFSVPVSTRQPGTMQEQNKTPSDEMRKMKMFRDSQVRYVFLTPRSITGQRHCTENR